MNFEFDFFGIDKLFSIPISREKILEDRKQDWIIVSLLGTGQGTRGSWLLLNVDRGDWKDDSAALELANVIAARKLAECDGLSLGVPQWMNPSQLRQLEDWLGLAIESGAGRWAGSRLPNFRWHLVSENSNHGTH